MALVLGEEDAIWIESAQEASKQYDHYELAAFREASCSNQVGGCPDLASSIGESPNAVHYQEGPGLNTTTEEVPGNRIRKRKKRSTYTPNTKEAAAHVRHEAARPFILAAYQSLRRQLKDGSLPRSWVRSASPESKWEENDVDFVALGSVWQADLAEIVLQDSQEHFQLFNTLVKNDCVSEVLAACMGRTFLLPKRSAFLLSDFTRLSPLIPATRSEGYDIILLDPPWENKSIKRQATYATLPNRNLLGLPLQKLAHSDGALVAIWVTNREKLRAFVEGELMAMWGLRLEATWHWLKVTPNGEMISPLDLAHHRPYEVLVLARVPSEMEQAASEKRERPSEKQSVASEEREQPSETEHAASEWREQPSERQHAASEEREQPSERQPVASEERNQPSERRPVTSDDREQPFGAQDIASPTATPTAPDNFVIVSVPGEHSRKPPLKRILEKYSAKGADSRGLELFARELTAGWTSWGNEVLRFQDVKYLVAKGKER